MPDAKLLRLASAGGRNDIFRNYGYPCAPAVTRRQKKISHKENFKLFYPWLDALNLKDLMSQIGVNTEELKMLKNFTAKQMEE